MSQIAKTVLTTQTTPPVTEKPSGNKLREAARKLLHGVQSKLTQVKKAGETRYKEGMVLVYVKVADGEVLLKVTDMDESKVFEMTCPVDNNNVNLVKTRNQIADFMLNGGHGWMYDLLTANGR